MCEEKKYRGGKDVSKYNKRLEQRNKSKTGCKII